MGRHKGKEWDHVKVIEQKPNNPKVECEYSFHQFDGGAPHIREHFLHKCPLGGVSKRTAEEGEIASVVAAMEAIDQKSKSSEQQAAKKRQLDRNTAAAAAAAVVGSDKSVGRDRTGGTDSKSG